MTAHPALTWVNVPAGGFAARMVAPQQATVPSVLSPQLWALWVNGPIHTSGAPALTWVNAPAGGAAWPSVLSPQQVTVPSVLSAQVCQPPALTWVNVPAGGVAWP